MIIKSGIVNRFGEIISESEEDMINSILSGEVKEEPSITDRFLESTKMRVNQIKSVSGINIRAITLTSRGPNAAERKFGADFCCILNANLPNFCISKGFLCQAKNEKPGITPSIGYFGRTKVAFSRASIINELSTQAGKMLKYTPDSFVITYSVDGFVVFPATSILGIKYAGSSTEIYGKEVARFFKEFLLCFIGDRTLSASNEGELSLIMEEHNIRAGILINMGGD